MGRRGAGGLVAPGYPADPNGGAVRAEQLEQLVGINKKEIMTMERYLVRHKNNICVVPPKQPQAHVR